MKRYIFISLILVLFLLLSSCDLFKSSGKKALIGIQRKNEDKFNYNIKSYDFNEDWKFEVIKIVVKQNENEIEVGKMLGITKSDWSVINCNKSELNMPKKGALLYFNKSDKPSKDEFEKFKTAIIFSGDFKAISNVDNNISDNSQISLDSPKETTFKVVKKLNENNYIFLDLKISNEELDKKKKKKIEEVSFIVNINELEEKIKNPIKCKANIND